MSGFSPDWLALREPVDHRSRDAATAARLTEHLAGRQTVSVVDLGCGAGSNIRATYKLLPAAQTWTLVDYDARLLAVSRERLSAWADSCTVDGDALQLTRDGHNLHVSFQQADLTRDLDAALGAGPDLVTASAFFDLCSEAFIRQFAKAVALRKAAFYTVLTYNGIQTWTPEHPADAAMQQVFHGHQAGDKGFGPAAGPGAAGVLGVTFEALGYAVSDGDSPWRLGPGDARLIADLATGYAGAVAETGLVDARTISDWSSIARTGAVVGHTDTLAFPGAKPLSSPA